MQHTKELLGIIDAMPPIMSKARNLWEMINKKRAALEEEGQPISISLLKDSEIALRADLAQFNLFRALNLISDPQVRAILMARALIGMPWYLMRLPDGTDALPGCVSWLDKHGQQILEAFRRMSEEA